MTGSRCPGHPEAASEATLHSEAAEASQAAVSAAAAGNKNRV